MRYADWIKTQGWTWSTAAREIGVSNATAARRLAHGTLPSPPLMARIYVASGGQVTPNDWYRLPPLPKAAREKHPELPFEAAA